MTILPSLKQKRRYVLFEIVSEQKMSGPKSTEHKFNLTEVKSETERAITQFLGELGKAKAAPMFVEEKFDVEKQRFVVRVNHKFVDEIKSALSLSKSIKSVPIIVKSVKVSGTLKSLNK